VKKIRALFLADWEVIFHAEAQRGFLADERGFKAQIFGDFLFAWICGFFDLRLPAGNAFIRRCLAKGSGLKVTVEKPYNSVHPGLRVTPCTKILSQCFSVFFTV
jgi:hypothetical protein